MKSCLVCRRIPIEKHEVFGGIHREKSKQFGLVVALCRQHHEEAHQHGALDKELKQIAINAFNDEYGIYITMQEVFGRNYLED